MAVKTIKTLSNVVPEDLSVKKVGNKYEIIRNKNVTTKTLETEEGQEEVYEYDSVIKTLDIFSRDHAVGVFVELEYSKNDEMSMLNKGLENKQNPEYIQYRSYVEWCKEQANVYFSK